MIESKDLRLWNWVSFVEDANKYQDYHQVTNITTELVLCHNGDVNTGELFPIPLSEELLIKCGFEKHLWNNGKTEGAEYTLLLGDDGFKLFFGWYKSAQEWNEFKIIGNGSYDEAGEKDISKICTSLHQLQNLYYSLTGKDINIEL